MQIAAIPSVIGQYYTVEQENTAFDLESSSPAELTAIEDGYESVPIGFTFDFFGNSYTQCYVATNGFIQFGNSPNGGCCAGQLLPNPSAPNNLIAAAWTEIDPFFCCSEGQSYNTYSYETIGTAPNRRFIVTFDMGDNCNAIYYGQIKLFEGTNIIEIHSESWAEFFSACTSTTQGIENSNGTSAYWLSGRNGNNTWTITQNDMVRFEPAPPPSELDASITRLLSPGLSCDTLQDVEITLVNLGTDTIYNALINWSRNGTLQTPYMFTGAIDPNGDSTYVTIATQEPFSNETDTLVFWATDLNGEEDMVNENDTLEVVYRLPLSGTYTIGGTNPDFTTIQAAVTAIEDYGVCGPVLFNIRNGTYTTQFTISAINGATAEHDITFASESQDSSAVTFQYNAGSANNYVVRFDGTKHVRFMHLGFKTLNTTYADIMHAREDASNITIEHCRFEGRDPGISSGNSYLFYTETTFLGDLAFRNNYFLNGTRGIFLSGNLTPLLRPDNILIEDNIFLNQRISAIRAQNLKDVRIERNTVTSSTTASLPSAIFFTSSHGENIIANNTVNQSGSSTGIEIGGMNNDAGVTGECLVYNNMSSVVSSNAIRIANNKHLSLLFNSAYSRGTSATDHHAISLFGGDSITVKNNIAIANAGRALSETFFIAHLFSDYNDLYTSGTQLAIKANTPYADLQAWQAGTGLDSHSHSLDPLFVSNTDLHVLSTALNEKAIPIAGITEDFDQQSRHPTTPDIGADEIGTETSDAGVFAILPEMPFQRGLQDIKAVLRNFGADTLASVVISWTLNEVEQQDFFYSGPLESLAHDTLVLGQVDFVLNTEYDIVAWTSMPNQTQDSQPENDTLANSTIVPASSGIVTIGAMGELTTIQAAVDAITAGGVLDSVHFHIQPGSYSDAIELPALSFMSCQTPVVFESSTGDATDVVWDNTGTGTHTILLNGADGIQFRNLTIKTTINAIQAIRFQNASQCNLIDNCIIEGVTTTNTSTTYAPVLGVSTSTSNYNHNNTIQHSTISKGSYNIYWDGFTGTTGLILRNNIFENAYNYGLNLYRLKAPVVFQNRVSTNSGVAVFNGIYLESCQENTAVTANEILMHGKRGRGIYLNNSDGTSLLNTMVANNFIIVGNGANSNGIHLNGTDYVNVFHNTIRISGGLNTGVNIYRQSGGNTVILNNILDNQAMGRTLYFDGTGTPMTTDYNAHYTEGTNLVYYLGTNYTSLAAWQATGRDTNSIHEEPVYDEEEPLGFRITNSAMNGSATSATGVATDIEEMPRDPVEPDIGCDEYNLFTHDVGLVGISYPHQPFPSGINTVYVKFINNGADTLTSMEVHWEVDSIPQPVYQWTGLLESAGTYDSLDIGTFDFAPNFYHSIKVWVSQPNGIADQYDVNDTLVVDSLYPGLHGIYTIGGIDPDFESLSAAVTELNRGGASDDVTFNIRSGTYLDAVVINDFPGSNCDRLVTFRSESGNPEDVLITNLGIDAYTIVLNGADGVVFKDLSMTSVNTAFRHVLYYSSGAHCNAFIDNIITGYQSTSTGSAAAVIRSASGLDTANVFIGNVIKDGSFGFYLQGSNTTTHTTIVNNVLDHPYHQGIYASSEYGLTIHGNQIICTYTGGQGIDLDNCHNLVAITANKITMPNGQYGIALSNCDATSTSPALIANNFISVGGSGIARALYLSGSSWYDILHNNLHVYSISGTQSNTAALYLSSSPSVTAKNNVLSNTGPGYTIFSNNNTGFISDYHCFQNAGDYFAYWNGGAVIDFETWQAIEGRDAHSFVENPQFMSDEDLHVGNVLLNGVGEFSSLVTEDIDGDVRNNPPDIGADEFVPSIANDAGVFMYIGPVAPFAPASQPVSVVVKNYGADTLESVDVRWLVNGLEQPVYHWTGDLPSAQCDTVIIGNYPFAPITDHDLLFWTEMPNAIPDSAHVNDTLAIDDVYPALAGTYTVGGVLPHFNLFSQLEKALDKGGILNDVTFEIRDGIYQTQFTIKDFPRASYVDYVTFTSESGDSSTVTIQRNFVTSSNSNHTVLLMNAHGIRFENVTLGSTKGRVLYLTAGTSDIAISHCRLAGVNVGVDNSDYQLISSTTSTEDSIVITHNYFEEGDYAIYMSGSSGSPERHIIISDNTFLNNRTTSIYTRYTSGVVIQNNRITNTENSPDGILVFNDMQSPVISGNDIRLLHGGTFGMRFYEIHGTASVPARIYNNYILSRNGGTTYGIDQDHCDHVTYSYNTVRLEGGSNSIAFRDAYSYDNIHIRNSNFANYAGGLTMHNGWANGYTTNTVNYCNLYSNGPVLAYYFNNYADLPALQSGVSQNLQGVSAEPLFGDDSPNVFQAALDSAGIPISGITMDINGDLRNAATPDIGAKEFTLLAHDMGAKLLAAPETYCGLSDTAEVTIRIQNYGANAESGFDVAYSFNGNMWVTENVGALTVQPGATADYTFSPMLDLSQVGAYTFALSTDLTGDLNPTNDTLLDLEVLHIPALVDSVSNMLPADNAINVDKPVNLSWTPAANATNYDVYVWEDGDTEPLIAQLVNLAQINTNYSGVAYGTPYNWKVVAKNTCDQMVAGPIQQFTIRSLPDLILDTVIAPMTAFTGQPIEIEWIVRNTGPGSTGDELWSDAVYLSSDATLNLGLDIYLGAAQNLTSLDSGVAYTHESTVTIPNNTVGNYYVFVYSDRYADVLESNNNNNWERSIAVSMIELSPLPDLRVIDVAPPVLAFSGNTIDVLYTVENNGTAATGLKTWHDRAILSTDPLNAVGQVLGTYNRTMNLSPDSIYTSIVQVTLPEGIFGVYYIHVHTDVNNVIYEFAAETNNLKASDTVDVLLSPPADLIITEVNIPDTISSDFSNYIEWTVNNAGAGPTKAQQWKDEIYISLAPVFNSNFNIVLAHKYHSQQVMSLDDYTSKPYTKSLTLPAGFYYIYGFTDITKKEYEYNMESNNTYSHPTQVYVANTDLLIDSLVYPDTIYDQSAFSISWDQRNVGYGRYSNKTVKTNIYASHSAVFDSEEAVLIKEDIKHYQGMNAGDAIEKTTFMTLPPSLYGEVYLHLHMNPNGEVYESLGDSNNIYSASLPMYVIEPPVPDIEVVDFNIPDTVTAGISFAIEYRTANAGSARTSVFWEDDVFISFDTLWMPSHALKLRDISHSVFLDILDSTETTLYVTLDPATTENVYYIYTLSDIEDEIYEGSGESNNIQRSDPFYVKGAPVVDLAIDTIVLEDDMIMSGTNYPLSWVTEVRNNNTPVVQSWKDRAFLSIDQTLDTTEDIRVGLFTMTTLPGEFSPSIPLNMNEVIEIPQGLSGEFYLILESDYTYLHHDTSRQNNIALLNDENGDPRVLNITLSPSADLVISGFDAPVTAIVNQSFEIQICIQNIGNQFAHSSWVNQVYLSADVAIGHGDIRLSFFNGAIVAPDSTMCYTLQVVIPASHSGNYYLIANTDALNTVYEQNGELNNKVLRAIEVSLPLPSDLVVNEIVIPVQATAGDMIQVSWKTQNTGANPAYGSLREIVYLSVDTSLSVEDVVFGVSDTSTYLPPQSIVESSLTDQVQGVIEGDYYAIVSTDALEQIIETNDDNNATASIDLMEVGVKTLIIDSLATDSLFEDRPLYYKVDIFSEYEGESLRVRMEGDSLNGYNDLYIKLGGVPTRGDFDFGPQHGSAGFQYAIVPSLEVGTYYIAFYGSTQNSDPQEVELLATIIPFEILSISPNKGVQNKKVTVAIRGAKLDQTERFRLRQSSPWFERVAESVYVHDDNLVYATFDLTDIPVDTYQLDGVKSNDALAIAPDQFIVLEEGEPDLQFDAYASGIFPNFPWPSKLVVTFFNSGDVDVEGAILQVEAPYGNRVAPTLDALRAGEGEAILDILLQEPNGPPGIVRPGGGGTIEVFVMSTPGPSFVVGLKDQ